MTDLLVGRTQEVFLPVWEATKGDDGYVSFELDALIEDPQRNLPIATRTKRDLSILTEQLAFSSPVYGAFRDSGSARH